jgi:hypothetical protein
MRPTLRMGSTGVAELAGMFDTRPQQLHFRMTFEKSRGALRLYSFEVELAPPA